jgi:hypothetical protein
VYSGSLDVLCVGAIRLRAKAIAERADVRPWPKFLLVLVTLSSLSPDCSAASVRRVKSLGLIEGREHGDGDGAGQ